MRKSAGLLAILAIGITVAFQPSAVMGAVADQPDPSASICGECCAEDALCQAVADLAALRASVEELVPQQGIANSLVVKVDAATKSVLALRIDTALNQLEAFGNELNAQEQSGQISTTVSNVLKTRHDTAKNSISNIR